MPLMRMIHHSVVVIAIRTFRVPCASSIRENCYKLKVVWKYGDDPTRFIEWVGCCCSGSCIDVVKPEEEKAEVCNMAPICRDDHFHFQHPVRTKACEALVRLLLSFLLHCLLCMEVAISQQSRWITQVIPMDMNIIELITAHGCVSSEQETISAQSYTSLNINEHLPLREQYSQWCSPHM
ncbi:hypothetical protein JHK87_049981 [Glycine soja]|nr:hypothetical protein JHK87_049981 [Glycine soja]